MARSFTPASLLALQGLPLSARAWHASRFPKGLVYRACQQQPLLSATAATAKANETLDQTANSPAIRPAEHPDRPLQSQQRLQIKHLHHQ